MHPFKKKYFLKVHSSANMCLSTSTGMSVVRWGRKSFRMSQTNYIGTVMLKLKNFIAVKSSKFMNTLNCSLGIAGNGRLLLSFILDFKFSGRGIAFFGVSLAGNWQNRGLLPAWPSPVTTRSLKGEFAFGFNEQ